MKQIILIRHAKVDNNNSKKILSKELQEWIKKYNNAPICKDSNPPKEIVNLTKNADIVLTSSLKRAKASADVLGLKIDDIDDIFNEADIPKIDIPFFKLTPKTWLIVIRILSIFGKGNIGLSLKQSKLRANKATKKLILLTNQHDSVFLLGHGAMNYLIRKNLLKDGWKLKEKPSTKNWGSTIVVK